MKALADLIEWEQALAREGNELAESLREYRKAWEDETFMLRVECERLEEDRDEARDYALRMRDALGRWAISGYDDPPWEEVAMEKVKTRVTVTVTLEVEHTSNREAADVMRIARDSIWCGGTVGFDKDGSFHVREISRSARQEPLILEE